MGIIRGKRSGRGRAALPAADAACVNDSEQDAAKWGRSRCRGRHKMSVPGLKQSNWTFLN